MSNESKDIKAEPAFPVTFRHERIDGSVTMQEWEGMRLQEYAAIHLKVPMSGTPWLDEMIEASRRDEFAKAFIMSGRGDHFADPYYYTDKILAASDKQKIDSEEYKRKFDDLGSDDI